MKTFMDNTKSLSKKKENVQEQPVSDTATNLQQALSSDSSLIPVPFIFIKSDLRLVIDLQTCIKAQQSEAYAQKVKLTNLKQMAQTVAYIQEHGYDTRADFNAANESKKSLEEQLRERDKQLETLKQLDAEGLQEKINTLQQENETTKQEYEKRITEIKFEHALSSALKGAKSKNDKAVQALLDMDALKLTESGEIIGLKEQLEALQKNDPYLFESDKKVPEIIGSTQGSPIGDDDAAMRAAFGLPVNKGE